MFTPKPINENLQQLLIDLVDKQTGLKIRPTEKESFVKKLQDRIKVLRLSSAEEYYYLLNKSDFISQKEWKELATIITNTESYFFRDQGQFLLLKNHLLPELIERKRSTKNLRIWSAGCSTGEEPYSLGILLQELIDDRQKWDIQLLATDLNQNAIAKAKQGIYSPWSFRSLDQNIINKYFHKIHNDYQINGSIREMTQFELLNLKTDYFPQENGLIHHLDLIICRNVFIYFSKETIGLIVDKFTKSLNTLGYLLTGHAELYGQNLSNLETKIFRESIVYQKPDNLFDHTHALLNYSQLPDNNYVLTPPNQEEIISPLNVPKVNPQFPFVNSNFSTQNSQDLPVYTPKEKLISESTKNYGILSPKPNLNNSSELTLLKIADEQIKNKQNKLALEMVDQAINLNPKSLKAYYLKAKILANMAQYQEAKKYCQKIIVLDSFHLQAYYLLAQIAEETQDIESAKTLFKQIIYLDNNAINAYLGMAYLYGQESNFDKSKKMYQTALSLVKKMKPNLPIEGHHLTSTELCLHIENELAHLEA